MKLSLGASLPGGPLKLWQAGAVFLPFFLPALYPLSYKLLGAAHPLLLGAWMFAAIFLPLFALVLVAAAVAGRGRSFPLWTLPALGLLLFFPSTILQLLTQELVFGLVMQPVWGGWPGSARLLTNIAAMLLVQALFLGVMLIVAAGLLRLFPGFRRAVQQEWTLLSFLLYGLAILPVLGNDEVHGIEAYEAGALLILAAGAGLYLLAGRRWQRALALALPALLSPALMSLAVYQAFPFEAWADPGNLNFRIWEALQPVLYLLPLPALLLLVRGLRGGGVAAAPTGQILGG